MMFFEKKEDSYQENNTFLTQAGIALGSILFFFFLLLPLILTTGRMLGVKIAFPTSLVVTGSFLMHLSMLAALFLCALYQKERTGDPFRQTLALKSPAMPNWGIHLLGWFLLLMGSTILVSGIISLLLKTCGISPEPQSIIKLARECDLPTFLMIAFSAVFLAPVSEELTFRHVFYKESTRLFGQTAGFLITTCLFVLIHGSLTKFLPLLVLAVILQFAYIRTKSVTAPILLHAAHNLFSMGILFCARLDVLPFSGV